MAEDSGMCFSYLVEMRKNEAIETLEYLKNYYLCYRRVTRMAYYWVASVHQTNGNFDTR